MRRKILLTGIAVALCTSGALAQDNSDQIIRNALVGRQVLVKMDLPAVDSGITMTLDDTNVAFDEANYNKLLREYGPSIGKGSRARITDVRVSNRGIEIDLDGGGSPQRDWFVGNLKLQAPAPLQKSDREIELERMIPNEANPATLAVLRNQLDMEQRARLMQDQRNLDMFNHVAHMRSQYLAENRKNWGSKLIVLIRSRIPTIKMRDMVQSLARYVELLPRETNVQ